MSPSYASVGHAVPGAQAWPYSCPAEAQPRPWSRSSPYPAAPLSGCVIFKPLQDPGPPAACRTWSLLIWSHLGLRGRTSPLTQAAGWREPGAPPGTWGSGITTGGPGSEVGLSLSPERLRLLPCCQHTTPPASPGFLPDHLVQAAGGALLWVCHPSTASWARAPVSPGQGGAGQPTQPTTHSACGLSLTDHPCRQKDTFLHTQQTFPKPQGELGAMAGQGPRERVCAYSGASPKGCPQWD